jgi:hypothetical protein
MVFFIVLSCSQKGAKIGAPGINNGAAEVALTPRASYDPQPFRAGLLAPQLSDLAGFLWLRRQHLT